MRRLLIWMPGVDHDVLGAQARQEGATDVLTIPAADEDGDVPLVLLHVPNEAVGRVVEGLQELGDLHVSFDPRGTLSLRPPAWEAPQQLTDVTWRSPLEILLGGLQSIGSWRGFLAYALLAGAVVWTGLFTNTGYLLVAAMLIAPFAGPAMITAMGTARGDAELVRRGVVRYAASLATTIAACALLTLAFGLTAATSSMVDVANLSTAAVLLPLAAGAAGAVNLSQSERSSLVSGAATGMLVAASLAPPAGLVGIAVGLGQPGLAGSAAFLLVLQLAGINLAGAAVFALVGLRRGGGRYGSGRRWVQVASAVASLVLVVGLVTAQLLTEPGLSREAIARRAEATVAEVVAHRGFELVEANARFPRRQGDAARRLLVEVRVILPAGADQALAGDLGDELRTRLTGAFRDVRPLIDVTALTEG